MGSSDVTPTVPAIEPSTLSPDGLDHAILAWMQELSPHGICVTDTDLKICGWNSWLETASGLRKDQVAGRKLFEVFPQAPTRRCEGYFRRALGGEISLLSAAFHRYVFPFKVRLQDGTTSQMLQSARIAPLRQNSRIVGTITIIEDVTEREHQTRTQAAKRQLARQVLHAEENERKRIARELHDGVNQLLASSSFRMSALQATIGGYDKTVARKVNEATELINKAISEIRLISRNLRPSELDDLGLHSALRALGSEVERRTGIFVQVAFEKFDQPIPAEIELTVYRIAQEAVNNVLKHAEASNIQIGVQFRDNRIELHVRDDGIGFDTAAAPAEKRNSWGLANIRERAGLFQGSVIIKSQRGKGTQIHVSIPST